MLIFWIAFNRKSYSPLFSKQVVLSSGYGEGGGGLRVGLYGPFIKI